MKSKPKLLHSTRLIPSSQLLSIILEYSAIIYNPLLDFSMAIYCLTFNCIYFSLLSICLYIIYHAFFFYFSFWIIRRLDKTDPTRFLIATNY